MKKLFLGISLVLPFSVLIANEDSAIANYKKTCKKCHGSAYYVAKVLTSEDWDILFKEDAKNLYKLHKNDTKATQKLNSNYFVKRRDDLRTFLMENAKDSGVVPPCNSTTCGFDLRDIKKTKSLLKKATP